MITGMMQRVITVSSLSLYDLRLNSLKINLCLTPCTFYWPHVFPFNSQRPSNICHLKMKDLLLILGYQFGELLGGRYEIMATHGKGVFSTVVRAKDTKAELAEPEEVAIKIIRNNETM